MQPTPDDAPCGLVRTAGDGLFLSVNTTFCGWLGYAADELVGKRKLQDLLTMGGKIFHQTHWAPLLQMQGSVSEVRLELRHKAGQSQPMIVNAVRRELDGTVVHDLAAFVARDRDRFEQELIVSRKTLETTLSETTRLREIARERALFAEEMVGIVSHDLRNPLSTIQMGANLMARGERADSDLKVLGRIVRAADRADRLISELLDLTQARLGSGLKVTPKPINLHATVADALDELALAYAGRELRHVKVGAGDCLLDGDRIVQLVGNLVSNAIAYGDADAAVTLTTIADADRLSVAVHNAGTPIPADAIAGLFQPMVRGEVAENTGRSVGLGLYIVSEIAKAHGGRVEVSSDDNGTIFTAVFAP